MTSRSCLQKPPSWKWHLERQRETRGDFEAGAGPQEQGSILEPRTGRGLAIRARELKKMGWNENPKMLGQCDSTTSLIHLCRLRAMNLCFK